MKTFSTLSRMAAALAASSPLAALAGTPGTPIPEPGTWALVALAGAIGVAISRSKRK